ncbi:hypothetical protein [Stenotrophomonas chelatiphaga]|uniref:hypothetical protein n=1 Tax=Stenotrophomonas chelatiphaga TaxID=517011 RepID=UPI00289C7F02|nr:hypothetical protein [Stenotrophomonas chelatiphaga]
MDLGLSPEAWSALLACAAIILSQLPPVRLWFKKPGLSLMVRNQAALRASANGPMIQLFLRVENIGTTKVRVDRVSLAVRRDRLPLMEVDAQGYFETLGSTNPVVFHPFFVAPEDAWTHTLNFFASLSREDERAYRREKSALITNIQSQLSVRPAGNTALVYADPAVALPLKARFERNFVWQQGEYELSLFLWGKDGKVITEEKYRMLLFESDREELLAAKERLATGDGIMFDGQLPPVVLVPLDSAKNG